MPHICSTRVHMHTDTFVAAKKQATTDAKKLNHIHHVRICMHIHMCAHIDRYIRENCSQSKRQQTPRNPTISMMYIHRYTHIHSLTYTHIAAKKRRKETQTCRCHTHTHTFTYAHTFAKNNNTFAYSYIHIHWLIHTYTYIAAKKQAAIDAKKPKPPASEGGFLDDLFKEEAKAAH